MYRLEHSPMINGEVIQSVYRRKHDTVSDNYIYFIIKIQTEMKTSPANGEVIILFVLIKKDTKTRRQNYRQTELPRRCSPASFGVPFLYRLSYPANGQFCIR